ncbi:hypothetical protein VM98_32155, partial [Streptomyces rubellomurinus subsp. indigoferus]
AGLERVDVVQPVLWAVMVALAEVWRSFGVEPAAVVGHSQGEIAAACVAGALSLEDGARVVALRSRALLGLSGRGGMVSVPLPAEEVERLLEPYGGRIGIAALNGPAATVVAGDVAALDELLAACRVEDVRAKRIAVDYASHCAHVEAIREDLLTALAGLTPARARIPFHSTVTGGRLDTTALDAAYWYDNLRNPVRFAPVVRALAEQRAALFVELSPHPVLTAAVAETAEGTPAAAVGSLRRDEGGWPRLAASLAEAWVHGAPVDWQAAIPAGARPVELPTYAFQRRRHWLDGTDTAGDLTAAGLGSAGHPLLGATVALADADEYLLTGRLAIGTHRWLADHAVAGTVLLPGTAFVELAVRAGDEVGCDHLADLTLETPLALPADDAVQVQVRVEAADPAGRRAVSIHARPGEDGPWTRHATGTLGRGGRANATPWEEAWPPAGAEPVALDGWYAGLAEAGYAYGPAFRGLRAAWRRGDEVLAEVALPEGTDQEAGGYALHPALLDAALHATLLLHPADGLRLPFAWTGIALAATGATALRVRITAHGDAVAITAADPTGAPVVAVDSLAFRQPPAVPGRGDDLYRVVWSPVVVAGGELVGRWAVVGASVDASWG